MTFFQLKEKMLHNCSWTEQRVWGIRVRLVMALCDLLYNYSNFVSQVVAIVQRNWREYVATVPKEEAESLNRKSGKRILVVPYDYRIPKVKE